MVVGGDVVQVPIRARSELLGRLPFLDITGTFVPRYIASGCRECLLIFPSKPLREYCLTTRLHFRIKVPCYGIHSWRVSSYPDIFPFDFGLNLQISAIWLTTRVC